MKVIIFREWFNHKLYPILYTLCIVVSMSAFLTLDALQSSVNDYIDENQKQMVGGDIIITDNQAWPQKLLTRIEQLNENDVVYDYQFNAIAYTPEKSLLTRIKAINHNYPLYGELILKNNSFDWKQGEILVEQQVLVGLEVKIGDRIKIGEAYFTIKDELISEPDRPLTAFGFGARILMHDSDLDKTQLLGKKSRISYRIEIKHNQLESTKLLTELKDIAADSRISVKTADKSNTSISNLSQNFLIFLKLLVIAVIILSAIGTMSIINAFVIRQENTNAIRMAIGEKTASIISSYRILFAFMAVFSVFVAWLVSLLVLTYGRDVFNAILPNDIELGIAYLSVVKALIIALFLTALTSHLSLYKITLLKPLSLLNQQPVGHPIKTIPWLWMLFAGIAVMALLLSELGSVSQALQIFLGLLLVWFVFALITKLLMSLIKWLLDKNLIGPWMFKLALQNIFRKGNHSNLFITALSMTTMILGSITILDYSIQQQLIATYPEDAPNLFLLDVQKDQQAQLNELFAGQLTYYPVIRARIESVKGVKTDALKEKLGNYDNISRMFNLSYADELLKTEFLYASSQGGLFGQTKTGLEPVSILSSFAEFIQVELGDEIVFNVQGIRIKTQVSSIRKRLKRGPSPFFYFIFPPEVMADAPQIRFATAKIEQQQRVIMQTRIAQEFPGITTLDGGSIANKLKSFTDQLTQLVKLFTALSLLAGALIFATSLLATSQDRLRESQYYRMMGMLTKDLFKLTVIEFMALGLFAFNLGVMIATGISLLISKQWFSLDFIFPWQLFFTSIVILSAILLIISLSYNRFIKGVTVIDFLRYE